MVIDADLGMGPFVAITAADQEPYRRAAAEKAAAALSHPVRVLIYWLADRHPHWDAMRLANRLAIDHDVEVRAATVEAFLESVS